MARRKTAVSRRAQREISRPNAFASVKLAAPVVVQRSPERFRWSPTVTALLSRSSPWRDQAGPSRLQRSALLAGLEDRRNWRPERSAPAQGVSLSAAGIGLADRSYRKAKYRNTSSQTRAVRVFEAPTFLPVCIRRKTRREVLFAKGAYGKGSATGPRRLTSFSSISCR